MKKVIKKTGGQPGHKGETLLMTPNPDKIIEHQPNEKCPQCGKHHTDEPVHIIGKRQVMSSNGNSHLSFSEEPV